MVLLMLVLPMVPIQQEIPLICEVITLKYLLGTHPKTIVELGTYSIPQHPHPHYFYHYKYALQIINTLFYDYTLPA